MPTVAENGHWVRFLQGIKTIGGTVFGLRTYLRLGPGLSASDDPSNDAYLLSIDASNVALSSWKTYAEGRSTTNVDPTAPPNPIGGVTLADGLRFLLAGQSDNTTNGLYSYSASTGQLTRTTDADTDADLRAAEVTIRRGAGAGERWRCMNTGPAVPGVNAITFQLREANGDKSKLDALISCTWPNIVTAAAGADSPLDVNGIEIVNAADPTTAQSLVTRQYFEDNLPTSGVSGVTALTPIEVDNTDPANPIIKWNPSADVPIGSHKITGVADGASAQDVPAYHQIADAIFAAASGYVPTSRQVIAGAGLTGGGALSGNVTVDVAAADASITVNANSIEASGAFVAKNISTTGTLAAGNTTITGTHETVNGSLATTPAMGRALRNTTASSVGTTRQVSPWDELESHARVSGADVKFLWRIRQEGRTNGNTDQICEYSSNGGSTWNEAWRCTTSTSGQFSFAFQSYAFATTAGIWHDASGSGLFFGGSGQAQIKNYDSGNPLLLYSAAGIRVQVNGGTDGILGDAALSLLQLLWDEVRAKTYTSTPYAETQGANGTMTLDLSKGQNREITLNANVTSLSVTNAKIGARVSIIFGQDATGGRTVGFGGDFEGGTALGAALDGTAFRKTSYWLIVGNNGKLRPLSAPYVWAS